MFRESVSALFYFTYLSQLLQELFSVLQLRSQVYISPGCANLYVLLIIIMEPYGEIQEISLPWAPLCFLVMQRLGSIAETAMKADHSLWTGAVQADWYIIPSRIHCTLAVGRELKEWELEWGRESAVSHSGNPIFSWLLNNRLIAVLRR